QGHFLTELSTLFEASLDPDSTAPLYRQLHGALRDAILGGRLTPGERLPSSRAMSKHLGCSRNSVTEAYDLLTAEGYLEGRVGAGSFVSRAFAEGWVRDRPGMLHGHSDAGPPRLSRVGEVLLEMGAGSLEESDDPRQDPIGPDPSAFPFDIWARALARAWRRPSPDQAFRGDPMGYWPLREAVADYLRKVRALDCGADQVMITSGAQHALDLIARLLLNPGDSVWMEDPSYRGARAALAAAGAHAIPVPVDGDGFDAARAADIAPDARAAMVTPSHQFPLGVTMSLARRMKLLEWAAAGEHWIVEDDYDSEFRYTGRPIPALQGLDRARRVIYVGTFSKAMFPGLRLGYLVLPPALVEAFRAARMLLDGHTAMIGQLALAEFIADGHFPAHLRRMRALYGRRRDIMLHHLNERLAPFLAGPSGEAGMHLLAHLREGLDDSAIVRRAAGVGVNCQALSAYHAGPDRRQGLVLGFGAVREDAIPGIIARLADVVGQR
ncbi:MAG: PLP-dependent aminotransferase family protein, partial [Alphaproteobacteria bacterium]|nr:PLP-dependent aminotransferase family protein [Alphaproteobacteria bacterium]